MNNNHSNDSFQSVRVFRSKAKTRLFLLASLPCLIGSAWAGSPSVALPLPGALLKYFKGSQGTLAPTPVGPGIMPLTPVGKPGPTPLGPPITPPTQRAKK